MRLLAACVTHNRLEYTRRTIDSWLATCGDSDHLVVFDNASTDGTREYLAKFKGNERVEVMFCNRNLFPGAATNRAWHHGLKTCDADLLQRTDNDIEYLSGWREEVERVFTEIPELALFGVHNRHEDYNGNPPVVEDRGANTKWDQVGGNCVMPRRVWDSGERWMPGSWGPEHRDEDSVMAAAIRERHGMVATAIPTLCNNLSFHRYDDYPDYYNKTAALRGLVPQLSV